MGRRRHYYVVATGAAISAICAGSLCAQAPVEPARPIAPVPQQIRPERPARDPLRDMSAEDRQRFQQNIERWRQMPLEERRELREREGWRQQRLKREADEALRQSGLQLEAERREQYERRYMQERKRIEQELRRELQEKRQRELAPVVEQLKKEFAQPQGSAAPSKAANSAAPSPGK